MTTTPTPHTPSRRAAAMAAVALLALAAACAPSGGPVTPSVPDAAATAGAGAGGERRLVMSPGAAVIVTDLRDPRQVGPRDPVRITSARIDGDSLRVGVETGGGCRQHVFRLGVSHVFMESNPVQVHAALGHDANGDNCRALLRGDLAASLAPLADAYRRSYATRTGTIVIHLEGWAEPLRYGF